MPLIDPNDDGLENGIGIAAYGFKQNPAKVTIGNIGLGENIFERLEYGIHTRNMVENETRYNKFYDTRFGMYLASHTKSAINIYENEFTNFSMGIFGLNMTNPINNCTVFNNRINPNGGIGATGIRLGANNGLSFYANVYGNGINGCRTGISILNATEVNTDFNTICFFSNPAPNMLEHVGIRALNCNKIDARENVVKWITHPPQANMSLYANKVKGYLFNTCSNGTIHNNQTHWCGHGFETIFNCPNLKFTCNLNQDTYNGFYLIGATLPNQVQNLGNDEANVNTWINNFGQFNIDGSCSPFEWYYDPNITNSIPVPFNPNFVQPKIETTAVDCSLLQNDELGSTLEGIIQDSTNYNNFIEENRYAEDEFAYHTLRADTMHELNIDSLLRLQFEQTMDQDVIGQFYQVAEMISKGEIEAAYNLNHTISDTRIVAENIKTVNDIFLRTVAIGQPIGDNDKTILLNMATTLSLVGGEATFWARSLLGVDFEDLLSNYLRESKTETTKDKLNVTVKLMPNPTNGKVILNSSHPINFIEVYNSLQQQVGVAQTNMDAQTIEFDFQKIEGNVFFIKAVFEQDVRFYTVIVNH
ncbi:MAG: hypothetical protein IPO27_16950 [Bacteroidetes bacterium]|nr:hypothetical protein [Bacteroidota bacterium]